MKVVAEGAFLEVFAPGSAFPSGCIFEHGHGDIPADIRGSLDSILPCVTGPFIPNTALIASYLVWPSGEEARAAWTALSRGEVVDSLFRASIRAHFAIKFCPNCGKRYQTLSVDAGLPYPGAQDLLTEKIQRMHIEPCPACGASFRQLVLRVLKEAQPGATDNPGDAQHLREDY